MAKANLIKRMEEMGFEADMCEWVQHIMSNRRATFRMDGREWKVTNVTSSVS
jgi:hypothetical protein